MNWKLTSVLAVLCVILGGVYLSWKKPAGPAKPGIVPRIFASVPRERVTRLEFARPGSAEFVLERKPGVTPGITWQVTRPVARAATDALVDDMLTGLFNLTLAVSSKPGDAAYDLKGLGLQPPEISVTVQVDMSKTLIRFGKRSTIDSSLRFFQVDNDPVIYIGLDSAATSFEKDLFQIRNRRLAILEIERLERIEVETRYEKRVPVLGPDGKPAGSEIRPVYETSTMEKAEGKGGTGPKWLLTSADGKSQGEELLGDKVVYSAHLIHAIICESFVERGDPKDYGLDQPDVRYRFSFKGRADAVGISLSSREISDGPDKGKRRAAARVEGNDEIALIKVGDFDRLLRKRNEFRRNNLFDVDYNELASVKIENGLATLELAAIYPPGDPPPAPIWSVVTPKGPSLASDDLVGVVKQLLKMEILDWLPSQPDVSPFGLNPPGVTVTMGLRRGGQVEPVVTTFGYRGGEEAHALRPKSTEIAVVSAEIYYQLDRSDLLARSRDVFIIPRADIKEVAVEFRSQELLAPVYYMIRRTAAGGWEFANTELKGVEVDERQVELLIAAVSNIQAEAFVTRRLDRAVETGIMGQRPPTRVTLRCQSGDKSRDVALNISDPLQSVAGGGAIYYAKFEPTTMGEKADDPFFMMIFRPREAFVDLIKRGVKKRKAIDDGNPTPSESPTPSPTDNK